MAVPFATQQLIRLVTEKVVENLVRQQPRGLPAAVTPVGEPGAEAAGGVDPAAFTQLVRYVAQLEAELKTLKEQHSSLERRIQGIERRWGWRSMLRMVVAVAIAFILGALLMFAAHLGGWY